MGDPGCVFGEACTLGEPCRPTSHAILGRLTLLHDWLVGRAPLNTSKLRVLVIAGEDTYFGVVRDQVRRLKPWFARIFYEVRRCGAWATAVSLFTAPR